MKFTQQFKNKNMRIPFMLLSLIAILSCSKTTKEGFYNGYETPKYKVEKQVDNIEIRSYKSKLIAEVEVSGTREDAASKGFKILAGYIFGKNVAQEKVAMTSPVEQKSSEKISMTAPVSQTQKDSEIWLVNFTMPSKYNLKNLPKAKDERIKFRVENSKKVVAIKFSGSWSDKEFAKQSLELEKFITQNNLKPKSAKTIAYYNDPFTFPWNRRNEIIVEIN
jgi:hypothetical protein